MLIVGDTVKIKAPSDRAKTHRFGWTPAMDMYDGKLAKITNVHVAEEDDEFRAYDIDIDDGEFGWLECWIMPAT